MNICFLGQGKEICEIGKILRSQNDNVVGIVTYPKEEHLSDYLEHECEKNYDLYSSVFDYANDNNIPLLESINLNLTETIEWILDKNPELLISCRSRTIFKNEWI